MVDFHHDTHILLHGQPNSFPYSVALHPAYSGAQRSCRREVRMDSAQRIGVGVPCSGECYEAWHL